MRCLIQFYDDWNDFRMAELDALLEMFNLDRLTTEELACKSCFFIRNLPEDKDVIQLCSRSVLIHQIIELWGYGNSLEQAIIESQIDTHYQKNCASESSWSISVDTYCRSFSKDQKDLTRQAFQFLNLSGQIKINDADLQIITLFDYSNNVNDEPKKYPNVPSYFGRLISKNLMREKLK